MASRSLLTSLLCFFAAGCSDPVLSLSSPPPLGTVARNAQEAWPQAPTDVPVLTRAGILAACTRSAECWLGQSPDNGPPITLEQASQLVFLCVSDLEFSGERAIPTSAWTSRPHTADRWAACVTGAKTCEEARACELGRPEVTCQEDGCKGPADWVETRCEGDQATVTTQRGSVSRDCSLAHARCDISSATGCTDRPYSQCAEEDVSRGDHCDGNIRLGCDGARQVSYHDCGRLGGTCGTTADGKPGCVYPDTTADCATDFIFKCEGGTLSLCVLDALVEQPSPVLCP